MQKAMKRNILVEAIANPAQQPIVFIFVITLGLGIAANGLSNLVLDILGDWLAARFGMPKVIWVLTVVIGVVGVVLMGIPSFVEGVRSLLPGSVATVERAKVKPLQQTFRGLIVLMSLQDAPTRTAILHHWQSGHGKLQHCWMIWGGERSLRVSEQLIEELEQQGIPRGIFHFGYGITIADPTDQGMLSLTPDEQEVQDPNYIRRLVEGIYQQAQVLYGLDETEIIADYTGGTKSMTAGVVLACTKPTRRSQYLMSEYDENRQPRNSRMMEVVIEYSVGR
jgi:CRISPR-associated protein (Cas_Cas02710)